MTHQGYADESAWARGQAWAIYGYTMMARETGSPEYLAQAKHIARFLMNHPNMPADKVPYWDFDAPNIPDAPRDASAAAIMASALIELSQLDKSDEAKAIWTLPNSRCALYHHLNIWRRREQTVTLYSSIRPAICLETARWTCRLAMPITIMWKH